MRPFLLPILSLFPLLYPSALCAPITNPHCDCYLVSGPSHDYFTHYKFWDFRNVTIPSRTTHPQHTANRTNLFSAETIPLSQTHFVTDWRSQSWSRGQNPISAVTRINADENAFFAKNITVNTTELILRTTRLPEHSSTAEIDTRIDNIYHCSLRVRMRIMKQDPASGYLLHADPGLHTDTIKDMIRTENRKNGTHHEVTRGACAGIFIYRSATCESDVEILTSDPPHTVHYANQPDYDPVTDMVIPGASRTVRTLPKPWTEWMTHRMDWFSDATRWYADSQLQTEIKQSVPNQPSLVALNLWSDGGVWTGDMDVGGSVYMGIEWIELAYNVSSSTGNTSPPLGNQGGCMRPCTLDGL